MCGSWSWVAAATLSADGNFQIDPNTGVVTTALDPNPEHAYGAAWEDWDDICQRMDSEPERFTPWLKMEWERLNADFADRLPG